MGLKFDPVGGGQFKQAVQQIIEAEKQPLKQLESRKKIEEAKLKLFQDFKGKFSNFNKTLAEFTDFRKFRELKVDLGDGATQMSVTVDKDKAEPGTYTVQIDQLARRSSIITNGFENPDDPILGIGFVVANMANGESADIFVDEDSSSLRGVANLINRQPNSPIRASVIKDASDPERPWKLIMSSKQDGLDDKAQFPEFYFLDGTEDIYIDNENDAQNAVVQLDGFALETDGNDVSDFLPGINAHLKQARPDQPFVMTITEDTAKIAGKVKGLVDQINGILEFINKQNQVDDKSDTRSTFSGDSSLQSVEYRLRNLLHEGFPVIDPKDPDDVRFKFLNQIGVEFEKTGMVTFKEDKFTKQLESDYEGVSQAITGEYGLASQLRQVVDGYTRTNNGMLALREQGLKSRIKQIDDNIANKERRIQQRAESITNQFARLEASLGKMQQQQQYMQAALGGGGGNIVSQLIGG